MESHINVGSGSEVTIGDLALFIAEVTGFTGKVGFDASKPDGAPRKRMDSSRLANMGWQASISLKDALKNAYEWFLASEGESRSRERSSPGGHPTLTPASLACWFLALQGKM